MKNDSWSVEHYVQYLDARTRPARDLLAAIPESFEPTTVYDLGCGPGNSTILLKNRWSKAQVIGLDSSLEMLETAKKSYPDISFVLGDIQDFAPSEKVDCLFANASLQWLDNHEVLFLKLVKFINTQGILAIQMPNNFHAPSHQATIELLQSRTEWKPLLKKLRYGKLAEPFYALPWYYDVLTKLGMGALQLWETEYFQEMPNHAAIFDWVKGTGLRPVLAGMDENNQAQFSNEYIEAMTSAYPVQADRKILLPFRRVFMVGCKI